MHALREVALVALRLGCTAFGGPAVHIAMLREEVVVRRRWLTDDEFVDLLGATNLIPGPNSTEMVIHVGLRRAGWPGFLAGGLLFILPAAFIVLACAWAYVAYGRTPGAQWMLYGIKPVIIAVVVQAIWGLSRTVVRSASLAIVGVIALVLYLFGVNELLLLFGAGVVVAAMRATRRTSTMLMSFGAVPIAPDLARLALVFLKIGAVLYGSGYVLVAFLRREFVEHHGWMTDQQLLDAVAVGQFTPGPVFTTATFVGYLLGSWSGALVATAAIFLPSFVFVALTHRLIPRMRESVVVAAVLDGVNVAALALMAGVLWQLARTAVVDVFTATLALVAAVCLVRWKVNSAWLVLGGAAAAFAARLLGWI